MDLLHRVPRAPEADIPGPADAADIDRFILKTGFVVPNDLHEWLMTSNGPVVGPGGLFGIERAGAADPDYTIESALERRPHYAAKGWIPVAGDGCGNFYVVDTTAVTPSGNPVYFVEAAEPLREAAYSVASGIWQFLRFLLRKEVGHSYWPFDRERVLKDDPDLAAVATVPHAWEI